MKINDYSLIVGSIFFSLIRSDTFLLTLSKGANNIPILCHPDLFFRDSLDDSRYFIALTKPKIIFATVDMVDTLAQAATEENLEIELVTFGEATRWESFDKIISDQDAAAVSEFRCRPIASPDEIGVIVCSSGSTGSCKATMLSHSALINNMLYDKSYAGKDDKVVMWFTSFRWISGTILPLRSIYFHKTWVICPKYKEELVCEMVEKYNVRVRLHIYTD